MNSNELSRGAELTIRQEYDTRTYLYSYRSEAHRSVAQTDSNPIHIQEIVRR